MDTLLARPVFASFDSDARLYTGAINMFYDFELGWNLTTYVGGGFGIGYNDVDGSPVRINNATVGTFAADSSTDFLVQFEIGLGYAITDSIIITPAFRYIALLNERNGLGETAFNIFKVSARVERSGR